MFVRDHQRPAFHKALGVDIDWYGQEVFKKTSELSKQIWLASYENDSEGMSLPRRRPTNQLLSSAIAGQIS